MDTINTEELAGVVETISFDLPDLSAAMKQKLMLTLTGVIVGFAGERLLSYGSEKLKARHAAKRSADGVIETTATESQ